MKEKFETIIGNPPYVKYQNIPQEIKNKLDMSLFDGRSNLYLFFIYKCIQHLTNNGELIFIVPRDFLKATSSIKLNEYIYNNGTITDLIDMGDKHIFNDATPNCVIFRFEKGNFKRITNCNKFFLCINGQLLFTTSNYPIKFKDLFYVKVGAVSGANECFTSINGSVDFVYSETRKTDKLRRMFYNVESEELHKYKDLLLKRKVKKIKPNEWYMWERDYYKSEKNRIYVNCKTRNKNPFFFNECKAYDGSVLAIFPKFETSIDDCKRLAKELNEVNWQELGFICDGRFIFTQKSLQNSILPESFKKYL